ncbi:S8 family anti-phage peptidase IteS [Pseudomonas aeruginosa]|uniref:S8 family anti-phage peptidase IteS n=1 Tax=Pseudomonas aeruginosa TaxID=287 RepID=UPI000F89B5AB|nr:S8 family anti-phage peptidase IteS [Pseudomonas aeruginosa]RTV45206.1 S8 family peptidase [Pseudomonas aeruginosa]
MTRKKGPESAQNRPNPRTENPFFHIPFSPMDLSSVERSPGGGKKLLVQVDDEYRKALSQSLMQAASALSGERERYPSQLSTFVFRLREKGIAKSHRPVELTEETGLQPAGHARIDEMLVSADGSAISALKNAILTRRTKVITANLSAIEGIEPWGRARRNPGGSAELQQKGRGLLRLFQYQRTEFNSINQEAILRLLKSLKIDYSEIPIGRGLPLIALRRIDRLDDSALESLLDYPGVRQIYAEPTFYSHNSIVVPVSAVSSSSAAPATSVYPTVAVFDTGVSRDALAITDWVKSRDTYVLPPDTNFEHGTAVASLVAGAAHFNNGHPWIPTTQAYIHDVCALEAAGSSFSDLELRLREAVQRRPDIKVWNLSLGGAACDEQSFSEMSMALDDLSDKYGVLFVVAAGNYLDQPRRTWPNPAQLADRVSCPGESVRALTVGSISHVDAAGTLSAAGHPTPYSRCGPGPVFTPKPDITHVGGGVHAPWAVGPSSLKVLTPNNHLAYGFGTSYAAPIASAMAANTWLAMSGHGALTPTPALVKALLIHSAQLSSPNYEAFERRYHGVGRPEAILNCLYDSDDSFTLVFQADLVPGMRWRKAPYPIPDALIHNGKFRGEIIITAAYSPPVDPGAGSEYVRANVELSFGEIDGNNIRGKVPMDGEEGQSGYEVAQVEHGSKWSPVKVHRKSFPNGTAVETWGLQATAMLRAFEPALTHALPVTIIVTLRALDGNPDVRSDGVRALAQSNWVHAVLPVRTPIRT